MGDWSKMYKSHYNANCSSIDLNKSNVDHGFNKISIYSSLKWFQVFILDWTMATRYIHVHLAIYKLKLGYWIMSFVIQIIGIRSVYYWLYNDQTAVLIRTFIHFKNWYWQHISQDQHTNIRLCQCYRSIIYKCFMNIDLFIIFSKSKIKMKRNKVGAVLTFLRCRLLNIVVTAIKDLTLEHWYLDVLCCYIGQKRELQLINPACL